MFQYAALLGIAKRHGYEFCIPPSSARDLWREHQLFQAFELPSLNVIGWQRNCKQLRESTFAYDAHLACECANNVDLSGFFQSERYFLDQAHIIRKEFSFGEDVSERCSEFYRRIGGRAISLHVRRGDYLELSSAHPPCDLEYYDRALAAAPANVPVIIFSDDIAWCKQQPLFRGTRYFYSEGNSNIFDMSLMSMCDHHITANSAFSWWGAWLGSNPDKTVITPTKWFGHGYTAEHDTRDLIPPGWSKL